MRSPLPGPPSKRALWPGRHRPIAVAYRRTRRCRLTQRGRGDGCVHRGQGVGHAPPTPSPATLDSKVPFYVRQVESETGSIGLNANTGELGRPGQGRCHRSGQGDAVGSPERRRPSPGCCSRPRRWWPTSPRRPIRPLPLPLPRPWAAAWVAWVAWAA